MGTTPSPKPKIKEEKKASVRDRKARFKDMYRNHRSVKEITKGKRHNKNSRQQSPEPEKDDLASLLKEMRAGFKELKGDLAKTNYKMDTVNSKIDSMEKHQKESKKKKKKS